MSRKADGAPRGAVAHYSRVSDTDRVGTTRRQSNLDVDVVDVEVARVDELAARVGAHPLDEPRFRVMDVEEARASGPDVRERVHDAGWYDDGAAGLRPHRLGADAEFELSLEDVERMRLSLVEVHPRAVVLGIELELEQVELRTLELHPRDAMPGLEPLALGGADDRIPPLHPATRVIRLCWSK